MDQTITYTYRPGNWPVEDNPSRLCLPGRRLWVTRIWVDRHGAEIRRRRHLAAAKNHDGTITLVIDGHAHQAVRYYLTDTATGRRLSPVYTRRGDALDALDTWQQTAA